jgi:hypothetical protein
MTLSSAFSIASSGMNAAVLRQSAAGVNTANALTPGYKRLWVSEASLPDGGVVAKKVRGKSEGADLLSDVVSEIGALYSFKANVISLRTADRMTGTVINMLA